MLGIKFPQKLKTSDFEGRPPLAHLKRLTTREGIIQHADHEVPDPSFGYSIDDNARAAIVCLWHYNKYNDSSVLQLFNIYYGFIKKVRMEYGSFHNFLSFTEQLLDSEGSEDSIGRTIWALGEIAANHPDEKIQKEATEIIKGTQLEKHHLHKNIRSKAFIMLGLLAADQTEEAIKWADELVEAYKEAGTDEWQWFEDSLRYDNGLLPYALAKAYLKTKHSKYLNIAVKTFDWLDEQSRKNGTPIPIGQNGWYFKGKDKALYDQQPLEAATMVLAACAMFEATKERKYVDKALNWISWYYGNNMNKKSIFNKETSGIFDALTEKGVNLNQGAESIVTYLLAYLTLGAVENGDK